ncbi:hypothetical protein [Nocardioides pinisoli]|uniref:Helix-turn-helix domain-containing protein n=1 Tax=Nocardioides pinisoli TaxID=2950279 RepID=A0ABT1KZF7_9ACTN|nr:hypothetical protein [Nocardioides pinisoli]MCP3422729.1 hypothetical protein [Nocardioides pinisoli]
MADWVTQREAAKLLGVHVSLIPKLVRRGDLTPRTARPSLARAAVLELAQARAHRAVERERSRSAPASPRPPDRHHEWLLTPAAAALLGCSVVALGARARRGRVPSTMHDRRRWYRLDQLELMMRAKDATQRRSVP